MARLKRRRYDDTCRQSREAIAECQSSVDADLLVLPGQRVLLDVDLAALYGVTVRRLNEQVRRNRARFPDDFIFYLNINEIGILKSQIATSSWGGKRKPPLAFNEHGAFMAATVLHSARAVVDAMEHDLRSGLLRRPGSLADPRR